MPLNPPPVRLRNVSKGLAKLFVQVAPGDELEVPADVAEQIEAQRAPLKPVAPKAKPAPKPAPAPAPKGKAKAEAAPPADG